MTVFDDVLAFWLTEVGQDRWYAQEDALDQAIRDRFGAAWEAAATGGLRDWCWCPQGTLAYLILTDQFPRNMFRGSARAFKTDPMALQAAKLGIARGFDMRVPEPQRQFYYLPLEHSEIPTDQNRAVRLIMDRMPQSDGTTLLHARAHRDVIRRFGRFPFRNAALGRPSDPDESGFLSEGGYGAVVRRLQEESALPA
ncbi:DUF924 family protein [Tropicimonas sp. S265A]|uniref:DUF924 family protein n=1 Tax=Tropicimonas sp. S265A TaxID=3415134 RepID=UPI003C7C7771